MTRRFLAAIRRNGRGVTGAFNLLEAAGSLSYRASADVAAAFASHFTREYRIALWPDGPFVIDPASVLERIGRRMATGDATVLWLAETCRPPADTLVTWNVRDFAGRTRLAVKTPQQFLRAP